MGDHKVLLFYYFFTPFLLKIRYEIGEINPPHSYFKNHTELPIIIEEIFKENFPGQVLKAFATFIIIKGIIKGEQGKPVERTSTFSELKSNPMEIKDYHEIFIKFPDPESNKNELKH